MLSEDANAYELEERRKKQRGARMKAKRRARRTAAKSGLGTSSGKKFRDLVAKLRKQPGVRSPEGLAAWIGRRAAAKKDGASTEAVDRERMLQLAEASGVRVTLKDVQKAFRDAAGESGFRYDRRTQKMFRTSADVLPGVSLREYKKQKVVKGVNKAVGPSVYQVVVYTGTPGSRWMTSGMLPLKDALAHIRKHADSASKAMAAEVS